VLDEIFARADKAVAIRVAATAAQTVEVPSLDDAFLCLRPASWWRERITHAARGRVAWHLETFIADAPTRSFETLEAKSNAQASEPSVWVLLGVKGGDNAQALDLAKTVGWRYETRQLRFNPLHALPNVLLGGSLANLDRERSAPLGPPWPDLVISAGKRSVPVARWIHEQSGGRARLVHIGRPWAPLAWFDLIITTPQYGLPARPNVLHNTLPLHSVDVRQLMAAPDFDPWKQRTAALPRPYTVLLVGGDSPPMCSTLPPRRVSARKPRPWSAATAVRSSLRPARAPAQKPRMRSRPRSTARTTSTVSAKVPPKNPYRSFLALADRFIVTGDSASMLAEACATGHPVSIYPVPRRLESLPGSKLLRDGLWQWRASRTSYRGTPKQQDRFARFYDGLVVAGLITPARDLGAYHERLRAEGLATIGLDKNATAPRPRRRMDDMERAVERVRRVWTAARPVA